MRIRYTEPALEDLEKIRAYIAANYPEYAEAVGARFRSVLLRIATWPKSAQEVAERPGVRVAPLIRYPYKIFYRIERGTIEILHIYHGAQDS
ncbi:hypothetical protein A3A39_02035 [Candidatus Kaiserbacteria bacterium RIFCSPLOWO2_01_FULL_54_13]|uniref:Plasmid stabilization protein n=1 Tax=Candidatus Kaiserbacteria bacterium RIFCSPLOWO2_01_FULL_54_13 TaxID=1798512 RepID=A0A1F6F153_9BACT|nr:MAG: hypothetical protein A3A39_02035 [Candidatus Kaiserbacteria bacterium RIFCSPLOWO2_01_FULL_54_13]